MSDITLILRSKDALVKRQGKGLYLLHVADKIYVDDVSPAILFDSKVAILNPEGESIMIIQHKDLEFINEDGPLFYAGQTLFYQPDDGNIIIRRYLTAAYMEVIDFALEVAPEQGSPLAYLHVESHCTVSIIYDPIDPDEVQIEAFNPNMN